MSFSKFCALYQAISTTNPQQPTHPHVDIYLQDLLDNTQTVFFAYDEDKPVSEQSQGPGMLTTYKHGPQASQCLINVKGFLALFSHRRDCYDEVRHSTSSMTRVRMTITVYDKDKHNIKLEFGFKSSTMQSGNGKLSTIEYCFIMILLYCCSFICIMSPSLIPGMLFTKIEIVTRNGLLKLIKIHLIHNVGRYIHQDSCGDLPLLVAYSMGHSLQHEQIHNDHLLNSMLNVG